MQLTMSSDVFKLSDRCETNTGQTDKTLYEKLFEDHVITPEPLSLHQPTLILA